jgi:drug/metabolite transporter (DMT)-like permease
MATQKVDETFATPTLTGLALLAFAANSILCRLALGQEVIDAASFAVIRIASGAVTLVVISELFGKRNSVEQRGSWRSAAMLVLYAAAFSFAYIELTAGTGALILFVSVQATMILAAIRSGERPHTSEWAGLSVALIGLVYLTSPGLSAPPPWGSALMIAAGISWGAYTLLGRDTVDAVAATTGNFVRSVPLILGISLLALPNIQITREGVLLAVLSGSATSGLGYVVWYAALRGMTTTHAAAVQLSVPVLAAIGGAIFLSETISLRLVISAIAILGGVGLAVTGRELPVQSKAT